MKPKRIILVRHGESLGNIDNNHYRIIPDFALDLTEAGKAQSRDAGEQIAALIGPEDIRAYVSPWERARQTFAGIASVLGDQVTRAIEDPRIREQDWGHLTTPEKLKQIQSERNEYSTFYYRIPDGESAADVYDRVSTFMETLHRDFAKPDFPENVLIVTHGVTLRIFLARWFHWSPEFYENVRNPKNGEVVIMEQGPDGRYVLADPLRLRESVTGYDVTRARIPCLTVKSCGFEIIASYKDSGSDDTRFTFFRQIPGVLLYQRMASFILDREIQDASAGEEAARELWEAHKELILSGKGLTLEVNEPRGIRP